MDRRAKDAYPLPQIDDSLWLLGNQQWFSTMDLASGYWQVAMSPDAKRKVAFVTNEGLFQFSVMPFSICNAPATFERLMDKDPFPHPAIRGGVLPRLLSCVRRVMAIARLTHLRISIPASGAPPGRVPADCYPGGAPQKNRLSPRGVSFAEDVTVLGDVSPSVCSPKHGTPTQLVSAVADEDVIVAVGETNGSSDTAPDIIPPPPGFSPFSWPVDDGNMDIEQSCFPFNVDWSPDILT